MSKPIKREWLIVAGPQNQVYFRQADIYYPYAPGDIFAYAFRMLHERKMDGHDEVRVICRETPSKEIGPIDKWHGGGRRDSVGNIRFNFKRDLSDE